MYRVAMNDCGIDELLEYAMRLSSTTIINEGGVYD
jgi:hypothetical protein